MATIKVAVTGVDDLLGQQLIRLLLEKRYTVMRIGRSVPHLRVRENLMYSYQGVDISDDSQL